MSNRMYVGDLLPALRVEVTEDEEPYAPIDLTAATSVTVRAKLDGVSLFERPATSYGVGFAAMDWQAADTDTAGTITVEITATFSGGRQRTYRAQNSICLHPRLT
ncbi:MAG: hypothetical protein ACRCYU_19090 [Nocardioides sp.]